MSDPLFIKLRDQILEAIKNGYLKDFRDALGSELWPIVSGGMGIDELMVLAAFHNKQEIVDYLLTKVEFSNITNIAGYAYLGFCKGGHKESLLALIERMMPLKMRNRSKTNTRRLLDACIKNGHIDMARTVIEFMNRKPYAEFFVYSGDYCDDSHPYRALLYVCLAFNSIELVDELFEKCAIQKSVVDFEYILITAKALNALEFVKKLESWKEKYPYQTKPAQETRTGGLILGSPLLSIGHHPLLSIGHHPFSTNVCIGG